MSNNNVTVNKPIILQLKELLSTQGFCFAIPLGEPSPWKHQFGYNELFSGETARRGRSLKEVDDVCNVSNIMKFSNGTINFAIFCNNIVKEEKLKLSTILRRKKYYRKVIGGLVLLKNGECILNIHGEKYHDIGEKLVGKISSALSTLSVNLYVYDNDLGWEYYPR